MSIFDLRGVNVNVYVTFLWSMIYECPHKTDSKSECVSGCVCSAYCSASFCVCSSANINFRGESATHEILFIAGFSVD